MSNGSEEILKFLHSDLVAKLTMKGLAPSPIQSRGFWLRFLECIRSDAYVMNIAKGPLVFVVNTVSIGGTIDALTPDTIKTFFDNGSRTVRNVFYVDYSGKIIATDTLYDTTILTDMASVTEDSLARGDNHFHIFIIGNEVQFIYKQVIFHTIADIFSLNRVGNIKGSLPLDRYRTLIETHFQKEVEGEKGFVYWQNKINWELVAAPEEQFRKRLMNFIQENVSGGYVDEECFNAGTSDRTDIRMIELQSKKVYIIEVKWIGKSVGATYDGQVAHDKANEGITQLAIYVKTNPDCIKGILVVYDARKDKFEIVWATNKNTWDIRLDKEPFLLRLDPISASNKAKETVKNFKKESKKK